MLSREEGAYPKFGQRLDLNRGRSLSKFGQRLTLKGRWSLSNIRITPCSERSKELNQNLHSGFLSREEKAYLQFGERISLKGGRSLSKIRKALHSQGRKETI